MAKKKPAPQPYAKPDQIQVPGKTIFSPLRQKWLKETPEERVRQEFVKHLKTTTATHSNRWMRSRRLNMEGKPRADIVVYAAPGSKTPIIVVECKAESVNISLRDYYQGESYARATGCEFFVTHNQRQTAIFKLVPGTPGETVQINDLPHAQDWGDAKRIEAIKNITRAFSRKEFQDLLFKCHSILRDVHKMEPGRAFDAISKILFIKMYIERTGTGELSQPTIWINATLCASPQTRWSTNNSSTRPRGITRAPRSSLRETNWRFPRRPSAAS